MQEEPISLSCDKNKCDSCFQSAFDALKNGGYNCIVVLGPTAVGKTSVAVRLADCFSGEIISADSRQVYKGLDIGSGKDLCEFTITDSNETNLSPKTHTVPYHLIDVATLEMEYSVFNFQQDAYTAFSEIITRNKLPVIVGGTGMYLDSLIRGYNLLPVPENPTLRTELLPLSMESLAERLRQLKGELHNDTDITERHRLLRAIEIETYMQSPESLSERAKMVARPDIKPFIFGTTFPREVLRKRIAARLRSRFSEGMIEEVKNLHEVGVKKDDGSMTGGFSWERLERLGLEYRFIAEFLQHKIANSDELFRSLNVAIGQFAKRQETWYRGMERKGVQINWIPADLTPDSQTVETRFNKAISMLQSIPPLSAK